MYSPKEIQAVVDDVAALRGFVAATEAVVYAKSDVEWNSFLLLVQHTHGIAERVHDRLAEWEGDARLREIKSQEKEEARAR